MNETDLSDDLRKEEAEFRQLMWSQLTTDEKTLMKIYSNNLMNNKVIHIKLQTEVNLIMTRYPDFDISCVP